MLYYIVIYCPISVYAEHVLTDTSKAYVNVLTRGDLSSLRWIESPLKCSDQLLDQHPDSQLCNVSYAAVNWRDVIISTAKAGNYFDILPGLSRAQNLNYKLKCITLS